MLNTRRFAAPIAALILVLTPAAALAQSAGDDQYTDPFGDSGQSQGPGSGSGGSGSGSGSGSGTAGTSASGGAAGAAQVAPSATPVAPAASGTAAAQGGQLPRTGLDAGVVAAIGAGLVGMGLVLRRRTADARR